MRENRAIRLDELNLWSIMRDLILNFWVILLIAVSARMAVSAYAKLVYVPEYTSTATLAVGAKGNAGVYTSLNMNTEMAQVFAEVFRSDVLREKIEAQMDASDMDSRISTSVIPQTNLMTVSVTSKSPEEAFRVLNIVLENYPSVSDYIFGNAVLEVIKNPQIPISPSNRMETGTYQKYAFAGGAAAAAALIVLLSVTRDTIKTPEAARRRLDGRILATIGHEEKNKTITAKKKKKNIAALITNPLASFRYMEAYQNLCSRLEYSMRRHGYQVILVSSVQENEGKSTVAANLALALSGRNNKVLLLDCDFRKPAVHKIFEVKSKPEDDFGRYLSGHGDRDCRLYYLGKYGLTLGVNQTAYGSPNRMIASDRLKSFLNEQREKMDYIILDSPPMLAVADTEALAEVADTSVLVVRQDFTAALDINDSMDALRQTTGFCGFILNDFREFSLIEKKRS